MSDLSQARTDPEALLWSQLEAVHAGMLGIEESHQHLQPMAHYIDRKARRLWFLTKADSDLLTAVTPGAVAHFVTISKSHDFHACMSGGISEVHDRATLDQIWNPMAGAWFSGKEDPDLRMLRLDLRSAAIWASTGSSLAFAWETVKGNLTESQPDVGVRNEVEFA